MTQPTTGLAAQGPLPAGMLRIQQGNQERYVWPVHLPGWLALGWRVAGTSPNAAERLPQAMAAPAATLESPPEPSASPAGSGPEPGTGRGKRGRRRKEEEAQPPATAEANAAAAGAVAELQSDADSDPPAATDLAVESAAEPGDDSSATGAVALSALPDDLFSDPLI